MVDKRKRLILIYKPSGKDMDEINWKISSHILGFAVTIRDVNNLSAHVCHDPFLIVKYQTTPYKL